MKRIYEPALTAREIFQAAKKEPGAFEQLMNKINANPAILMNQKNGIVSIVRDAADQDNFDLVRLLAADPSYKDSFVNGRDEDVRNVLFIAIEKNAHTIINFLMAEFPVLTYQRDIDGNSFLHMASFSATTETLRGIIFNIVSSMPESVQKLFTAQNNSGYTALHYVTSGGDVENVRKAQLLIEKCPELKDIRTNSGETAFDMCGNNLEMLRLLNLADGVAQGPIAPASPPVVHAPYIPTPDEVKRVSDECKKIVREMCENNLDTFKQNGEVFHHIIANNTGIILEHIEKIINDLKDEDMVTPVEAPYFPTDNELRLVAAEYQKLLREKIGGDNVENRVELFAARGDIYYPMIAENTGVSLGHVIDIIENDFAYL